MDSNNKFSTSSFIPFCEFGGNMSVVGKKIDKFSQPVCNKFVRTNLNGQNCYSIDINQLREKIEFNPKTLGIGLKLFLDYNIERQTKDCDLTDMKLDHHSLTYFDQLEAKDTKILNDAQIYFSTLGKDF